MNQGTEKRFSRPSSPTEHPELRDLPMSGWSRVGKTLYTFDAAPLPALRMPGTLRKVVHDENLLSRLWIQIRTPGRVFLRLVSGQFHSGRNHPDGTAHLSTRLDQPLRIRTGSNHHSAGSWTASAVLPLLLHVVDGVRPAHYTDRPGVVIPPGQSPSGTRCGCTARN